MGHTDYIQTIAKAILFLPRQLLHEEHELHQRAQRVVIATLHAHDVSVKEATVKWLGPITVSLTDLGRIIFKQVAFLLDHLSFMKVAKNAVVNRLLHLDEVRIFGPRRHASKHIVRNKCLVVP